MRERTESTTALLAAAALCLDDARNKEISLHTRYSAACAAVTACHLAGLATNDEVAIALAWEIASADPTVALSESDLDVVIAVLDRLLPVGKPGQDLAAPRGQPGPQ